MQAVFCLPPYFVGKTGGGGNPVGDRCRAGSPKERVITSLRTKELVLSKTTLAQLPPTLPIPLHRDRKTVKNHLTYFSLTHSTQASRGHMATGQIPYLEPPKIKARYMGEGASGVCFGFFWVFLWYLFFFARDPSSFCRTIPVLLALTLGTGTRQVKTRAACMGLRPARTALSLSLSLSLSERGFLVFFFALSGASPKKLKLCPGSSAPTTPTRS
uniref:Uncharacterized protein n=1 Tax=Morchella importuna TaxID=1174673 RepID=A0A650AF99_9PEZI|nr:hypothetical protein [Morchella importuna]QGN66700.1 hypothetical protein [Morchella importuna]